MPSSDESLLDQIGAWFQNTFPANRVELQQSRQAGMVPLAPERCPVTGLVQRVPMRNQVVVRPDALPIQSPPSTASAFVDEPPTRAEADEAAVDKETGAVSDKEEEEEEQDENGHEHHNGQCTRFWEAATIRPARVVPARRDECWWERPLADAGGSARQGKPESSQLLAAAEKRAAVMAVAELAAARREAAQSVAASSKPAKGLKMADFGSRPRPPYTDAFIATGWKARKPPPCSPGQGGQRESSFIFDEVVNVALVQEDAAERAARENDGYGLSTVAPVMRERAYAIGKVPRPPTWQPHTKIYTEQVAVSLGFTPAWWEKYTDITAAASEPLARKRSADPSDAPPPVPVASAAPPTTAAGTGTGANHRRDGKSATSDSKSVSAVEEEATGAGPAGSEINGEINGRSPTPASGRRKKYSLLVVTRDGRRVDTSMFSEEEAQLVARVQGYGKVGVPNAAHSSVANNAVARSVVQEVVQGALVHESPRGEAQQQGKQHGTRQQGQGRQQRKQQGKQQGGRGVPKSSVAAPLVAANGAARSGVTGAPSDRFARRATEGAGTGVASRAPTGAGKGAASSVEQLAPAVAASAAPAQGTSAALPSSYSSAVAVPRLGLPTDASGFPIGAGVPVCETWKQSDEYRYMHIDYKSHTPLSSARAQSSTPRHSRRLSVTSGSRGPSSGLAEPKPVTRPSSARRSSTSGSAQQPSHSARPASARPGCPRPASARGKLESVQL